MRILLAILLLMVIGCERSSSEQTTIDTPEGTITMEDGKVTVQTRQDTATIEASDGQARIQTGEGTMTFGGNKVPQGFPLEVMPGSKVEHSSHVTPAGRPGVFQVSLSVAAPVEQIADFYEKALRDKELSVTRSQQTVDGNTMVMLIGESPSADATAMILHDADAEQPTVMISWNAK
jgi:hypothetical protein